MSACYVVGIQKLRSVLRAQTRTRDQPSKQQHAARKYVRGTLLHDKHVDLSFEGVFRTETFWAWYIRKTSWVYSCMCIMYSLYSNLGSGCCVSRPCCGLVKPFMYRHRYIYIYTYQYTPSSFATESLWYTHDHAHDACARYLDSCGLS